MDESTLRANFMSIETAAATPPIDAFWFSFTYYARPALLEGVISA